MERINKLGEHEFVKVGSESIGFFHTVEIHGAEVQGLQTRV
jgi:hypothetical protein